MRKYLFFIGIDISKNWIDVSLTLDGRKEQMPHARFDNTKKGFAAMLKFIKSSELYKSNPGLVLEHCLFCMEHTGVYSYHLVVFCKSKN